MPHFAKYSEGIATDGPTILKDGHTMFPQDIVKDLNRKSYLEQLVLDLEVQFARADKVGIILDEKMYEIRKILDT